MEEMGELEDMSELEALGDDTEDDLITSEEDSSRHQIFLQRLLLSGEPLP